jgi:Bacterial regulatory helix-turn-helix protein, lysR family
MDFHGIDLNLLVAFDALMSERNVTRAAARVGVSQPAMSAALSRLRKLFGDLLFLRGAQGLLPTPRARDLAEPLSQAIRTILRTPMQMHTYPLRLLQPLQYRPSFDASPPAGLFVRCAPLSCSADGTATTSCSSVRRHAAHPFLYRSRRASIGLHQP